MKNQKMLGLDNKDIQNLADGRTYGSRGLGFVYRFFNGLCTILTMAGSVYFLALDSHSPIESFHSVIPESIQNAPIWLYYILTVIIMISLLVMTVLSRILNKRSKDIADIWLKSGKLPKQPDNRKGGTGVTEESSKE